MISDTEIITIDLTSDSFLAESITNSVIEIIDESFESRTQINTKKKSRRGSQTRIDTKQNKVHSKSNADQITNKDSEDKKLGDCPICYEELGTNELASTKCGHVFCYKCLNEWIRSNNCRCYCPICGKKLSGKTAFHRLYLNI